MKSRGFLVWCVALALGVVTFSAPAMAVHEASSHLHVDHVLQSWAGTPGERGLLPTALAESEPPREGEAPAEGEAPVRVLSFTPRFSSLVRSLTVAVLSSSIHQMARDGALELRVRTVAPGHVSTLVTLTHGLFTLGVDRAHGRR